MRYLAVSIPFTVHRAGRVCSLLATSIPSSFLRTSRRVLFLYRPVACMGMLAFFSTTSTPFAVSRWKILILPAIIGGSCRCDRFWIRLEGVGVRSGLIPEFRMSSARAILRTRH